MGSEQSRQKRRDKREQKKLEKAKEKAEKKAVYQAVLSDGKAQGFNGLLDMNNNEAFMAQFAGRAPEHIVEQ